MDEFNNIKDPGKISRENPFTVPGNYFDEFPARLQSRLNETTRVPVYRFMHNWKPYAVAAVLLIIALVAGYNIFRNHPAHTQSRLHAEISNMVETELYSINEETIIEAMAPEEQPVKQDEAIDYLLNGGLNEDELLNEL